MRPPMRSTCSERASAPIRTRCSRSSSRPAGTAWSRRASSGSRTAWRSSNLRYLAAHETAHQWFYGLVGNDQSSQPFADEAAADFVARSVLGMRRGEPLRDVHAGSLDLRVHLGLLLRDGLHPGRQPARRRPPEDGLVRVLGGAPRLHRGQPLRDRAGRATLLDALDAATPLDLRVDDVRRGSRGCSRGARLVGSPSPGRAGAAARRRAHPRQAPSASGATFAG